MGFEQVRQAVRGRERFADQHRDQHELIAELEDCGCACSPVERLRSFWRPLHALLDAATNSLGTLVPHRGDRPDQAGKSTFIMGLTPGPLPAHGLNPGRRRHRAALSATARRADMRGFHLFRDE